jgi:hypothetical protein
VAAREDGLTSRLTLSLSPANTCNPLLQAHPPWAQDNTRPQFPFVVSPLCSVSRLPIWAGTRNDNLLVGPGTPGVETPTVGAPGRGLLRVDEQLPVKLQMGSLQQPLQPGTMLRFVSVEFMSLDGSYDMILLPPPRDNDNGGRQHLDTKMVGLIEGTRKEQLPDFRTDEGVLWFRNRLCVPKGQAQEVLLDEAHNSAYSINLGTTKMYLDLKTRYWWRGMKQEIAQYVARCDTCQRTKVEHQKPAGLLQPLPVPKWKWEEIGMDFVTRLPRTQKGNDSIWVIIDCLTKVAHFIPVKTTFGGATLARIYLKEIVRLHGIPRKIVSDRGTQFTSKFWMSLQQAMGTKLDFSTAYHPQSDG